MNRNKIFIGNLPYSTDRGELIKILSEVGTVKMANIVMTYEDGPMRKFGVVTMDSDSEADDVIVALDGTQVDGNAIVVNREMYPKRMPDQD